jgi:hypothetical protein
MAAAAVEALVSPAKGLELSEATLRKTSERVAHQDIRLMLGLPIADLHVAGRVGAFRGQGTSSVGASVAALAVQIGPGHRVSCRLVVLA